MIEQEPSEAMEGRNLSRVVEALIFAADAPVTPERIAGVFAEVTGEEMPDEEAVYRVVARLNATYEETDRTFRIEQWGGGLRLATVPEVAPYLRSFFSRDRQRRLSRSVLETLAIIAYRQPVTKPEVDFVRGVDSDYAIRKLLEMGLVDVRGRSNSLGRPLLYGTTASFLEQFGINDLRDLPSLREIEEILDDPAFNTERAQLLQLQEEEDRTAPNEASGEREHGGA
jgi:segregation and condensation protein B